MLRSSLELMKVLPWMYCSAPRSPWLWAMARCSRWWMVHCLDWASWKNHHGPCCCQRPCCCTGAMLVCMGWAVAIVCVDACESYCHQRTYGGLWSGLLLEAMLVSVICVVDKGHVDVCDQGYHGGLCQCPWSILSQGSCWCLWSLLPPGSQLKMKDIKSCCHYLPSSHSPIKEEIV